MSPRTRLALDVLCAVDRHVNERGTAPTVPQLADLLRRRSCTPVQRQVRRLIRHGLLLPAVPDGVLRPTQALWCAPDVRPHRARRWYGPGSRTDVDEVAVERTLDGDPDRPLGIAEKVAAVRLAARRGWNDREIADRIGVTPRHVLWIRQQHGIRCGVPVGTNQHSPRRGGWGLVA